MKQNENTRTGSVISGPVFLFAALVLSPLTFSTLIPENFEVQKAIVTRVFLLCACMAYLFSPYARYQINRKFGWLVFGNVALILLSIPIHNLNGVYRVMAIDRVLAFFAMVFASVALVNDTKLKKAAISLSAVLALISFYGFANRYFPEWLAIFPSERLTATFNHPNTFAQYAAPMMPVLLALVVMAKSGKSKIGFFTLALFCVIPFILTYTRGAILAAAFGCFAWIVIVLFLQKKVSRIWKASLAFFVLFACFVVILWGFDRPSPKRFRVLQETGKNIGRTMGGRLALWRQSAACSMEEPLFGWGPGQTQACMAMHRRNHDPEGAVNHWHAHQDYVQVASEYGIPAAMLYIGLLIVLLVAAFKELRARSIDGRELRLHSALLAGALVFLVYGLIGLPLSKTVPRLYAFVFLGVVAGPSLCKWKETPSLIQLWKKAAVALPVILFAILFFFSVIGEGRAMLQMTRVKAAFKAKDSNRALELCSPILTDSGFGYFRQMSCLVSLQGMMGRSRVGDTYAWLVARDHPKDYFAQALWARALLDQKKWAETCDAVSGGVKIWAQNPKWGTFLTKALENAKTREDLEKCVTAYNQYAQLANYLEQTSGVPNTTPIISNYTFDELQRQTFVSMKKGDYEITAPRKNSCTEKHVRDLGSDFQPDRKMDLRIGHKLRLTGYEVDATGGCVDVNLCWECLEQPENRMRILLHVRNDIYRFDFFEDFDPPFPSNKWEPGKRYCFQRSIGYDKSLPPGAYMLTVGVYDPEKDYDSWDLLEGVDMIHEGQSLAIHSLVYQAEIMND